MLDCFDVHIPWRIGAGEPITIDIRAGGPARSKHHFLRFDLYPIIAPSAFKRHFGFWDLPMTLLGSGRTTLRFQGGELLLQRLIRRRVKPSWKGALDFCGYCAVHVSLWETTTGKPVQKAIKSSRHLILPENAEPPLAQIAVPATQRCNLRCRMCPRQMFDNLDNSDIAEEVIQPVIEASVNAASVHIMGHGEALMNRNVYDILARFRKRMLPHHTLGTCTNGTLLNESRVARLLDTGLDYLFFSLDGATPKTAEASRPGCRFEDIVRNIRGCVEYRRTHRRQKPWLMANFMVSEDNVHEIPDFARMAVSLGLDSVSFSHMRDPLTGKYHPCRDDSLDRLFSEAMSIGREQGLAIVIPDCARSQEPRCESMQAVNVFLNGEVGPGCQYLAGSIPMPIRTFGNVRDKPLMDIWNSREFRDFRHDVMTGRLPDVCVDCDANRGLLT